LQKNLGISFSLLFKRYKSISYLIGMIFIGQYQKYPLKNYKKAIIVDDDIDLCIMLKSILQPMIPEIQCANTIKAGKDFVLQSRADLVFVDNHLPDGQGVELVKVIKRNSPTSTVIFITAVGSLSKDKAMANGADAFIEKPLTHSSIMKALGQKEVRSAHVLKHA
jgi:DNA-binding NtrC family response regulator